MSLDSKKIVCVTTRLSTGGAELNALLLAEQFIARGYEAELWSLYRVNDLRNTDVPIRVMSEAPPKSLLELIGIVRQFVMKLHAHNPGMVLGFQPLANVLSSLAMARRGKFVASQRNPSASQRFPIRVAEAIIGSTSLYSANVAVSHSVLNTYRYYPLSYRRRLCVIHNGLPPLQPIAESKEDCRDKLGLPQGVPIIGNIGRLHNQKNPEFLIEVLKILPGVHLMLAGDGPDEASLRARAAPIYERVHFLGRVDGENITRSYRALDLFVFPSRFEGFGRSLVEAMSQGIPIIANDLPITREVVGSCGTFVPLEVEMWSKKITELLDGEIRDIEAARRRAHDFSLRSMVDGYLEVLDPHSKHEGAFQ